MNLANTRVEHDLIGDLDVPADAYYGAHTARAVDNFPISGVTLASYPGFIAALAAVKQAAATANRDLSLLDRTEGDAIIAACEQIRGGAFGDQFVVDMIQGGAGTSTNMNANEVIANVALEILGKPKGDYGTCHPLDHVNKGQSTNDVYPTAVKLALDGYVVELRRAVASLREAFAAKAVEFADVLKIGRTQLQDAVPMTLGQEFATYAVTLAEDETRLEEARILLHELNLGGTAIGTALNAHPEYQQLALANLRAITGIDSLVGASDLIEATQDVGVFVQLSGVLKRVAVKLSKICSDLRLLSSGPRAGLNEIHLPARQAGSSIMPGKVNPVIPEVVNQIAFEVIGNDVTVTLAAEGGQLQLNAFEPIIAKSLFDGMAHLAAGCATLQTRCVEGITANTEHLAAVVAKSIGLVTALNPAIGYASATAIAQEALSNGRNIAELVLERNLLSQSQIDALLSPSHLTGRARNSVPEH
ncbi:aspartate ammonia-lyase [Antrihabitans cavernicola]|uniref:aspartate ammonia-lyase n=1 Tax=Antrihabitans cavernicola TaxID=2495913 RepID=A0A5A7SD27_9NOCA|nr:aspartate ammonia-lyase [Spelaeibacter cavernicola]KAA0024058.1 aspartate ammonia-lyase [Spelaeibacter cavernicola]